MPQSLPEIEDRLVAIEAKEVTDDAAPAMTDDTELTEKLLGNVRWIAVHGLNEYAGNVVDVAARLAELATENARLRKVSDNERTETTIRILSEDKLIEALVDLPEVPPIDVLRLLSGFAMNVRKPDLWTIGKKLQRKFGLSIIPSKTEYECSAGLWHCIRMGLCAALAPAPKEGEMTPEIEAWAQRVFDEDEASKEEKMTTNSEFLDAVAKEIGRARTKFPNPQMSMCALTEEVGELAQALLHARFKDLPWKAVYDEAVQVATMAMRVATEGDPTIATPPKEVDWGPPVGKEDEIDDVMLQLIKDQARAPAEDEADWEVKDGPAW